MPRYDATITRQLRFDMLSLSAAFAAITMLRHFAVADDTLMPATLLLAATPWLSFVITLADAAAFFVAFSCR